MGIADVERAVSSSAHNLEGNCWDHSATYECDVCGAGNLCDVCHEHESARGDCPDCKRCKTCDDADTRKP